MSLSRPSSTELRCSRGIAGLRRWLRLALVFVFTLPGAGFATYGAEADDALVVEYQLKAAFVYNFAKFVEWPVDGGADAGAFTLCVVGELPYRVMQQALAGKRIRGLPLVIRSLNAPTGVDGCQLLFVGAGAGHLSFAPVGAVPVLTVGESGDFLRSGGMINLVRVDNRLRFEIARSTGERAGLKFSSQLLKLATPAGDAP
ncbi:MAG TPA: YfiR family protein [Aromatoleum sp.]|uniref:YfiR family protein n=1 Tax=Aromatoleum sp. TaxID=2307007 RepID=UPI002B473C6B|nr:YfiR family protein [Aromatoleum sp.]HJV24990.1 YfiR family protein [Aromatoleum sp.]